MAIGSSPEVGASFKSCKDFTMADWEAWWAYMRANWGEYLHAGWATLVHEKNNKYYRSEDERDTPLA